MKVTIKGMDALVSGLKSRANPREVQNVVMKNGAQLQQRTISNMNSAYTHGYSTGRTARSTGLTMSNNNLTATVKPTTNYFPYLEYGTRFMAAMPTLKPAFDVQYPMFINELERLCK